MKLARSKISRRSLASFAAMLAVLVCTVSANASPMPLAAIDWKDYWLNTDYANHGKSVDQIFYFIFWLTTIIMVAVEVVLVWFMFKYRHREGSTRKAIYSHGSYRQSF
jgi:heme/copper-type cytochrome/quinol oxidase subunit 2